ncbi:MAG: type IV toxin-antitoxin system AbiEi family antitoxin [Gammaproteobacteria bacterium]
MTRISENKINKLMTHLSPGSVVTAQWLKTQGISPKLAWWYVHSGWLERIGNQAYQKKGEQVNWIGAVSALQTQLQLPVHVGGKSALELQGKAHFIVMQDIAQVTLFSRPKTKIPSWIHEHPVWSTLFSIYSTSLFQQAETDISLIKKTIEGVTLQLSSPERAIMELLHLVPQHQSLDEAALIMENLAYLRPNLVQSLLENCSSIKVKRLFLFLADRNQHEWLSALDMSKINLGQGKRVIGVGGEYHPKYKISVPKLKKEGEINDIGDIP